MNNILHDWLFYVWDSQLSFYWCKTQRKLENAITICHESILYTIESKTHYNAKSTVSMYIYIYIYAHIHIYV